MNRSLEHSSAATDRTGGELGSFVTDGGHAAIKEERGPRVSRITRPLTGGPIEGRGGSLSWAEGWVDAWSA